VQWSSSSNINLKEGVAVPVRAYLESYDLVQLTGKLDNAYPGFTDAVAPNVPLDEGQDASARDRRPSEDVAAASKVTGNLAFRIETVEQSGDTTTVTACRYRYGLAEEQSEGEYSMLPTGGPAEARGITGVRLTLTNGDSGEESALPSQEGSAPSPDVNVFGGWKIQGYLTSAASSNDDWPTHDQVEAACIANAPDPLDRRDFLIRGPHPASEFAPSPPEPGWPAPPSQ
jgi:hypothetical protein